jgi:hypothetical protein
MIESISEPYIMLMINQLMKWIKQSEMMSYDWWDLWATSFGGWAKSFYSKNKILGIFIISPIFLFDLLYPNFRKFFAEKRAYPICHAQIGLGYLNLYEVTKQEEFLTKAEALVDQLIAMASPHIRGLGWGMKHNWMTLKGLIPKDTPCNTQTAYPFEFFEQLYNLTGRHKYMYYLEQISEHIANDFHEWYEGDWLISSYSTIDSSKVVNANSYRMLMLLRAGKLFNNQEYFKKGLSTLRYVLSMQKQDGSWPYAEEQPFVDNYHTCFIIKNLFKIKKIASVHASAVEYSIARGLSFYFSHLFDSNGYPVPFAIKPRLVIHKYDSYDLAESIGLLAELKIEHKKMNRLLHFAKKNFLTREGWFVFRRYPFLHINGIPYLRYANSAMFNALTKALKFKIRAKSNDPEN